MKLYKVFVILIICLSLLGLTLGGCGGGGGGTSGGGGETGQGLVKIVGTSNQKEV